MASPAKRSAGQVLLRLGFVVYCLWMLWLLFGQRMGTQVYTQQLADRINLVPFATMRRYFPLLSGEKGWYLQRHAIINLVGNVVMFIPLSFCIIRIFPRFYGFFRTFLLCLILIIAVETVQYFTMLGTCDIDDLILNMLGVSIGGLLGKIKRH
ncbi:MAG: VanZ family protein [Oscillospiraceae bacterium]|nr:VanZ family protein [Oscillospiraceae bacterium]